MSVPENHYHAVQFYKDDASLAKTVARFFEEGLRAGEPAVMIATPAHTKAILRTLSASGCNVRSLCRTGQLQTLDADKVMASFMGSGTVDEVRGHLEILAGHCADVGRDIASIEKTLSYPIILRDTRAAAEAAQGVQLAHNGIEDMGAAVLLGSPTEVADALHPYVELGFETFIVRMPGPYDRETIDRMAEVRELLDA